MPEMKHTAKSMLEMLNTHYFKPSKPLHGLLLDEVTDPTGRRRADALFLPMTSGERGRIIGYEVKVSRADIITEISDPTKADAWARYCHQWYLAVPDPRLIEGLNIPEDWGIVAPPSGRRIHSMTVIREAAIRKPIDTAPALGMILAKCYWGGEGTVEQRLRLFAEERQSFWQEREDWRREKNVLTQQIRALSADDADDLRTRTRALVVEVVAKVMGAQDDEFRLYRGAHGSLTADDYANAILDHSALLSANQAIADELEWKVRSLKNAVETIATVVEPGVKALESQVRKDARAKAEARRNR